MAHPTSTSTSTTSPFPLNKRAISTILAALCLIFLLSLTFSRTTTTAATTSTTSPPNILASTSSSTADPPLHHHSVPNSILKGDVIAGKIENATAKAELGRASWHTFHTIMAKFPDRPTAEEQTALASYIHLWARLYPCGECASHFRAILTKYPPQVSTRSNAAAWACHVHNEVNRSLDKTEFDCSRIGDFYDCGCADEVGAVMTGKGGGGRGAVDGEGVG